MKLAGFMVQGWGSDTMLGRTSAREDVKQPPDIHCHQHAIEAALSAQSYLDLTRETPTDALPYDSLCSENSPTSSTDTTGTDKENAKRQLCAVCSRQVASHQIIRNATVTP